MNTPKRAKAEFDKLVAMSKRDQGVNTSEGVRQLANVMFITCREADEFDSDQEVISALALLSGMACGVLLEYADRLKQDGQ